MTTFQEIFNTDENLESGEGIELDYGDCGTIIIHRAGGANRKFQWVLAAKFKPYERQMRTKTMKEAVSRRLLAETYAETVLVGWRGVKDASGQDLPFTSENATKLLLDVPELFEDIREQAYDVSNFRREQVEETAKNLPTASATS